jgi:hypothetical protein
LLFEKAAAAVLPASRVVIRQHATACSYLARGKHNKTLKKRWLFVIQKKITGNSLSRTWFARIYKMYFALPC